MAAVIGVVGAALLALMTFFFDRRRATEARTHEERVAAAIEFTRSIEAYRSTQKRRAHHNLNHAGPEGVIDRKDEDPLLATAVGESRTAAWAAYHHVVLVAHDQDGPDHCRQALKDVSAIGTPPEDRPLTHEELDKQGDLVRDTMRKFASHEASQLNGRVYPRRVT
jgi:hypothetical protein